MSTLSGYRLSQAKRAAVSRGHCDAVEIVAAQRARLRIFFAGVSWPRAVAPSPIATILITTAGVCSDVGFGKILVTCPRPRLAHAPLSSTLSLSNHALLPSSAMSGLPTPVVSKCTCCLLNWCRWSLVSPPAAISSSQCVTTLVFGGATAVVHDVHFVSNRTCYGGFDRSVTASSTAMILHVTSRVCCQHPCATCVWTGVAGVSTVLSVSVFSALSAELRPYHVACAVTFALRPCRHPFFIPTCICLCKCEWR